jgi:hypothetical protein
MLGIALLALGASPALAQDSTPAHPPAKDSAHAHPAAKDSAHAHPAAKDSAHAAGQHAPSAAGEAMMHHSSGWAELDEYHMLMMATWHPAKKKNDLAPIRAQAADLAAAAAKWEQSAAPAGCAGDETKQAVAKVAADSRTLAAMVERNDADAEVKTALAELHDGFEAVMHACAGAH